MKNEGDTNINFEDVSVIGVDFVFSEKSNYSISIRGIRDSKKFLGELNLEGLLNFVEEQAIDLTSEIDKIRLHVHNEEGKNRTDTLKLYLDCSIDEQEFYCLLEGKWHQFNPFYLEYLKREIDSIPFKHNLDFDIDSSTTEDDFNKKREKNDGYNNFDKVLQILDKKYKVEKMDLYKDETLFFVKIGNAAKLSYVIDQSINTVKLLQNNQISFQETENICVNNICLWLILENKNNINQISDIKSIILQMKLVEWKRIVKDAGFAPLINLNYRR
jgi:uncharacterized protein (TIGR04141 family)